MNWLAHALLADPDSEVRLGNVLADLVKGRDRAAMSPAFLQGVGHHQAIDSFTDFHPVVGRSKSRLGDGHRHTRGILVDIFYDHFLAVDWVRYSAVPLAVFTARLYADARAYRGQLPADIRPVVDRMSDEDWLGGYQHLDGVEDTLRRVSERITERVGRDLGLERGIADLLAEYDGLGRDFAEFFPAVRKHTAGMTAAV